MSSKGAPKAAGSKAAPRPKTIQPSTGVKVEPAPHGANAISTRRGPITTFESLLAGSCRKEFKKIRNDHIIQTSFENITEDSPALAARNGFVDSVVLAYNKHHHLVIRPEDVWFSILVQLNVYINGHAEEMRSMFVAHDGQKELKLWVGKDPIDGKKETIWVDWAKFAHQIGKKIEENIHDPTLRTWFMPAFTTTTKSDQATVSIIMMSAMQKYFTYGCGLQCGLPSVTLLGEKRDWEEILARSERLKSFGDEPTMFHGLLKPVLQKFVKTFDDPDSEEIRDFWQHIAHYSGGGSGPTYLSGWITAFCFWSGEGECFYKPGKNPSDGNQMGGGWGMGDPTPVLVLDGARYHRIETDEVPPGYASVPVELDDDGIKYKTEMVAGSVGMMISASGLELEDGKQGFDTIQPGSGWCMYEIMSEEEALEKGRIEYEKQRKTSTWMPEWEGKESLSYLRDY